MVAFESVCNERHFLRWVAKAAEQYFQDPAVQARFEKWQAERREKDGKAS